MAQNPRLAERAKAGVAVWLDDLSRDRLRDGDLQTLIEESSVVGVTTNPTIFAAAISGSDAYDDQVHAMAVRRIDVGEALRAITAADVRDACDLLGPVARRTGGDGRVSLEVSPRAAQDTDATAAEAAHLWWLVDRYRAVMDACLAGLEQRVQDGGSLDGRPPAAPVVGSTGGRTPTTPTPSTSAA